MTLGLPNSCLQQACKQASKQACKQASKQANKQASKLSKSRQQWVKLANDAFERYEWRENMRECFRKDHEAYQLIKRSKSISKWPAWSVPWMIWS